MGLEAWIRDVPDFPKKGIIFKDITPLIGSAEGLREAIETLRSRYAGRGIEKIVAVESRGFIFGAALAYALGVGFVPVRKPGKLPSATIREEYALEYGTDAIEMHRDALEPGQKVLVLDDVLATGGTLAATCRLVQALGGEIVEVATLIELCFLNGRAKLGDLPYYSVIQVR
ncbi:MAG: adenine phosphoribosyltransferase [Candidatus Sumerlaeia bacterium]|nr:adenine phosphoribosyltransferase [Candidatus Sumerlaeia bacterium]